MISRMASFPSPNCRLIFFQAPMDPSFCWFTSSKRIQETGQTWIPAYAGMTISRKGRL